MGYNIGTDRFTAGGLSGCVELMINIRKKTACPHEMDKVGRFRVDCFEKAFDLNLSLGSWQIKGNRLLQLNIHESQHMFY